MLRVGSRLRDTAEQLGYIALRIRLCFLSFPSLWSIALRRTFVYTRFSTARSRYIQRFVVVGIRFTRVSCLLW